MKHSVIGPLVKTLWGPMSLKTDSRMPTWILAIVVAYWINIETVLVWPCRGSYRNSVPRTSLWPSGQMCFNLLAVEKLSVLQVVFLDDPGIACSLIARLVTDRIISRTSWQFKL